MPTIDPNRSALLRELNHGGKLPVHSAFAELAWLYADANPEASKNRDLARILGAREQSVSQWKTGSDPSKIPPWSAILLLCALVDTEIRITPAGITVEPAQQ